MDRVFKWDQLSITITPQGPGNMRMNFDFEPKDIEITHHEVMTVFLASFFEYLLKSEIKPHEIAEYMIGIVETTQTNFERYLDATNETKPDEDSNA